MSTSSITEDIHFNIGLNRTALVIITAGNIVFINKIIQNSVDSLGHILFRSEHRWEDPNITNPPTLTNHPTKNSNAKVIPNGPVYTRGGFTSASRDLPNRAAQQECH